MEFTGSTLTAAGPAVPPLLELSGLRTEFATRDGLVRAVDGVDLRIPPGSTVCLVGESGCGKSVTARSILGLVDPPGHVSGGHIWWQPPGGGERVDLAAYGRTDPRFRRIRGQQISMIFQEPLAALSPMYTVGDQLGEMLRLHRGLTKAEARDEAIALLKRVHIPRPEQRVDEYSFQLSGGMCQRVMIAMALSCSPDLLIADEPTTALDVTIQARILDLIAELQADTGMSVLFITHDLGVVAEIADEVAVMYLGRVVEHGSTEQIFTDPRHPYTHRLLRSVPRLGSGRQRVLPTVRGQVPHGARRPSGCAFHPRCDHAIAGVCDTVDPAALDGGDGHEVACVLYDDALRPDGRTLPLTVVEPEPVAEPVAAAVTGDRPPLLEVRDLRMHFPIRHGLFGRTTGQVHAVDGVSLAVRPGETLGLVGESGCGKTTLGRCIVRAETPTSGQIQYRAGDGDPVDVTRLTGGALRRYQRDVRTVFQDPFSSLNPRMTLRQIIGDPLVTHGIARGSELTDRVAEMLRKVGLSPDYLDRYPHAFSGGQRQRVNIARALILGPRLVVADEAVSALDVSVRAQILNLLRELQDEFQLTYVFISHDLSVVEALCDRVAVMYLGKIVELADTATLFTAPKHPYTEALLSAVPVPEPGRRTRRTRLSDDLPDPVNPPAGCWFHTRCPHAVAGLCDQPGRPPVLDTVAAGHDVACLRHAELDLTGVRTEM
ncbi:ABC transporter ATP-binding protein [Jiangella rhizosphaerae]|uniref:ABC transporter ATP-binding protein n=1 Tax=Jiangella rhizosphaerae TaxID=2293569 RepID=A0A418KV41_9ACTN|nr:ABC transporter ATP-binding protein [Jiangella rhizosphaerae]RIQ33706.1 ABC transporter ATP-binding protein [Jiangella rhizosphaerae]